MTNLETRNACMRELERNKEDDQIENEGNRNKEGMHEGTRKKEGRRE